LSNFFLRGAGMFCPQIRDAAGRHLANQNRRDLSPYDDETSQLGHI
jgi:hypothetical protein